MDHLLSMEKDKNDKSAMNETFCLVLKEYNSFKIVL